jgi:hypothetical protein
MFLLLSTSGPDGNAEFSVTSLDGATRVRISQGAAAGPYDFERGAVVELFDEVPLPVPPGHPVGAPPPVRREVQMRVPLPPGAKNVLVLLGAASGRITQQKSLDQSLDKLPASNLAVINFVPDSLLLRMGRARQEVPANGRVLLPVGAHGAVETVLFQVARRSGEQWQKVVSEPMTLVGGSRRMLVLTPGGAVGVNVLHLPPAIDDPLDPPPPVGQ